MSNKTPKKIKVFSTAFSFMLHNDLIAYNQKFLVECNIDGPLQEFDSLDDANNFAIAHRRSHPGHKMMVTTTQNS